jgi:hypothetical protein
MRPVACHRPALGDSSPTAPKCHDYACLSPTPVEVDAAHCLPTRRVRRRHSDERAGTGPEKVLVLGDSTPIQGYRDRCSHPKEVFSSTRSRTQFRTAGGGTDAGTGRERYAGRSLQIKTPPGIGRRLIPTCRGYVAGSLAHSRGASSGTRAEMWVWTRSSQPYHVQCDFGSQLRRSASKAAVLRGRSCRSSDVLTARESPGASGSAGRGCRRRGRTRRRRA